MYSKMSNVSRRRILRGMMNGAAVTVALPFLDCFLNTNGDALANGSPMPTRFGTWLWGCGVTNQIFTPKTVGANYELTEQLMPLKGYQQHVNVYTNFNVNTDGRPNLCHYTGWVALRSGEAPSARDVLPRPSLDVLIADEIGAGSRFPVLNLSAPGNPRLSTSFRNADSINPPDTTALDFYQRIFGPEFRDPNSPTFTPDAYTMARKSTLSVIKDQSEGLKKALGAADLAKLDEYFTSLRSLENRLAIQLEKPAPAPACKLPAGAPRETFPGVDSVDLGKRHNLMVDLAVMALACNQTRVLNIAYSEAQSTTTRHGESRPHHAATHEEGIDAKLGYQPTNAWFILRAMEAWAHVVKSMAEFKEGDGSLLDHSLILANTESNLAQKHDLRGVPLMTAGKAGGLIKTGMHVDGNGTPGTRVGLTAMRAMGLKFGEWGVGAMNVQQSVDEVVA